MFVGGFGRDGIIDFIFGLELFIIKVKNGYLVVVVLWLNFW